MAEKLYTMSKSRGGAGIIALAIVGILIVVIIGFVMWAVGVNNRIVRLDQGVDTAWAQVQSQYQRRLDLIPNLVSTVKGAAQQEVQVVVGAVEARAKATQVKIDPANAQQFQQFAQAQSELGSALSRLLVTVERYPEIRTNQNFLELQSQIEGTENRISVERMNFNKAVQEYNNAILTFPGSLIAGFRNFARRPYFTGDVTAQKAPTVDFGAPATYQQPAATQPSAAGAQQPAATPANMPSAATPPPATGTPQQAPPVGTPAAAATPAGAVTSATAAGV